MRNPKQRQSSPASNLAHAQARWSRQIVAKAAPYAAPVGSVLRCEAPSDCPDTQLVALMWEGNPHALELFYRRHASVALTRAREILGDRRVAVRVTHEALLFMRRPDLSRPVPRHVRSWVLATIRDHASEALRGGPAYGALRVAEDDPVERFQSMLDSGDDVA